MSGIFIVVAPFSQLVTLILFTLSLLASGVNVAASEHKLMKKSRGRLIHISDFVEEENGRLVLCDKDGNITRDTRKIISGFKW